MNNRYYNRFSSYRELMLNNSVQIVHCTSKAITTVFCFCWLKDFIQAHLSHFLPLSPYLAKCRVIFLQNNTPAKQYPCQGWDSERTISIHLHTRGHRQHSWQRSKSLHFNAWDLYQLKRCEEITQLLKDLKPNKAPGHDGIPTSAHTE